jgi:hypothetical protein
MKKSLFIFFLMVFVVSSCVKIEDVRQKTFSKSVLIYICADNNGLSPYADSNLSDVVKGYLPKKIGDDEVLMVFLDNGKDAPSLKRYFSLSNEAVYEEIIKIYPQNFNSADALNLRQVLDEAQASCQSEHRGLILWSHGTGWLPPGYYSKPTDPYTKSFALDSSKEIDIKDLHNAINWHYDYIVFDCCLMSTVEVAYQLRDKADYIVASAAEVLAESFNYEQMMSDLLLRNGKTLEDNLSHLCKLYFDLYNNQENIAYRSATISLIDTKWLDELANVCKQIYGSAGEKMKLVDSDNVQKFYTGNKGWFYDLQDYISQFASTEEIEQLKSVLDKAILYKNATPMLLGLYRINYHCGLSTYIPIPMATNLNIYYKTLDWAKYTGAL